ncbi:AT-rich interactive domain-containing protein 5A isoform X1 [Scleropages formosus]|nr:AT-rich interactive domain-containing protein 5A isoform X1 [Scleropages formosus]
MKIFGENDGTAEESPRGGQDKRSDLPEESRTMENRVPLDQQTREMELCQIAADGEEMPDRPGESEMEEKTFVASLYRFMEERNTPIERIPHLGFKQINLWKIYKAVGKLGGYDSVTARRLWKNVYDELGGSPGSTSAATCTRRHYERLVLPFERHLRGEEDKPLPPAKPRKQYKKSPEGKGSKTETKKRKSQQEREPPLGAEEKPEDGVHCEMGRCMHSSSWPLPAERPQSDRCRSPVGATTGKELQAAACTASQTPGGLLHSGQPLGAQVISPLEKKKRVAQASLGLSKLRQSPEKDSRERPSVIHCAQSPGQPPSRRAHDSSEGSPVPRSSPSSSRSSSPCSISSDDCQEVSTSGPDPTAQAAPAYVGNFTSVPYSGGVCKPLGCYPSVKDADGYLRHHRDFQQVDPAGVKGQRPDSAWSPGCKQEDRPSGLKAHQVPSSSSTSAGFRTYWVPSVSGVTKTFPNLVRSGAFQPSYKMNQILKRPAPEEMATYTKKLQLVHPLHQGELKEKLKPGLLKPLPIQHSLFHAGMPIPYLVSPYDKIRPTSGHQLKGLSLQSVLLPSHLTLPAAPQPNSIYRHVAAGATYPLPFEPVPRPCPYPFPVWPPPTSYTVSGLHAQYPNTKL